LTCSRQGGWNLEGVAAARFSYGIDTFEAAKAEVFCHTSGHSPAPAATSFLPLISRSSQLLPDAPLHTPLPVVPALPGVHLRLSHLTTLPTAKPLGTRLDSHPKSGVPLERLETPPRLSKTHNSRPVGPRHLRTLRIRPDPPSDPVVPSTPLCSKP